MSHNRSRRHWHATAVATALVLLAWVPGAWAQDAAKPPAAEPKPSMTIYGFAMLDIGQNFTQIHPDWFDTMRVSKLPSYDRQYGEDGVAFAGVRQSRLGVKTSSPTRPGRAEDAVRIRALRHGRRLRPDDVPPAARLRRTGRVRRRPDVEPVHGPGRVPELARVLGPHRHGVLPQRAGALDADQGRHEPDAGPRAPGRERRRRSPGRPYRAPEHQGPHADARLHGRVQLRRRLGLRPRRGRASGRSTGTTCSTTSTT